jgi:protein-S-isoprenylcysteine O-methyltransferase Ste14
MSGALLSPLLLAGAMLLYGALHSALASLTVKDWVKARFGAAAMRYYRFGYSIFALVSLLPIPLLLLLLPDRPLYAWPAPWSWLGYGVQALVAAAFLTGKIGTGSADFLGMREALGQRPAWPDHLVTDEAYRWVRHPIYTAGLLFLWAMPNQTVNRFALSFAISLYFIVGAILEERKLIHEFGEDYQRYRRQVPMLIPWRRPS